MLHFFLIMCILLICLHLHVLVFIDFHLFNLAAVIPFNSLIYMILKREIWEIYVNMKAILHHKQPKTSGKRSSLCHTECLYNISLL